MRLISAIATSIAIFFCSSVLRAESVYVKYRGDVDLRFFDCWEITRSSFIKRVCYDRRRAARAAVSTASPVVPLALGLR
jgi:hypothetical protein